MHDDLMHESALFVSALVRPVAGSAAGLSRRLARLSLLAAAHGLARAFRLIAAGTLALLTLALLTLALLTLTLLTLTLLTLTLLTLTLLTPTLLTLTLVLVLVH